MVDSRQFRKWTAWLRRTLPLRLDGRYSISLVDPSRLPHGTDGYSWHYKEPRSRYVSFIANSLDEEKAIEALIHEYAHVACWSLPDAIAGTVDDDELHAVVMQRICKCWYRWMKERGVG